MGRLVVVEGSDAAGKGVQKKRLQARFEKYGYQVTTVREPGGTPLGEDIIREVLLREKKQFPDYDYSYETEFDLFTIQRRENRIQIIEPALVLGELSVVLADRSWISSVAYQGFGRGVERGYIVDQSRRAMGRLMIPDAVVVLDISEEEYEKRQKTPEEKDRIEILGPDFHRRVREGYRWVAHEFGFPLINGVGPVDDVEEAVRESIFDQLDAED